MTQVYVFDSSISIIPFRDALNAKMPTDVFAKMEKRTRASQNKELNTNIIVKTVNVKQKINCVVLVRRRNEDAWPRRY